MGSSGDYWRDARDEKRAQRNTEPIDWEAATAGRCKFCGANVLFVAHPNGRVMPHDAETRNFHPAECSKRNAVRDENNLA